MLFVVPHFLDFCDDGVSRIHITEKHFYCFTRSGPRESLDIELIASADAFERDARRDENALGAYAVIQHEVRVNSLGEHHESIVARGCCQTQSDQTDRRCSAGNHFLRYDTSHRPVVPFRKDFDVVRFYHQRLLLVRGETFPITVKHYILFFRLCQGGVDFRPIKWYNLFAFVNRMEIQNSGR